MKPVRNVIPLVIGLAAFVSLSGGCNPECPVGTTNQGNTCRSAHEQGNSVDDNNIAPIDDAASGGSGGLPRMKSPDTAGKGANGNTAKAGDGAVAGRGTVSNRPGLPVSGAGGESYQSEAAGSVAAGNGAAGAVPDSMSSGGSGTGAGAGGDNQGPAGVPCSPEGAIRCAENGMGARESCRSGIWSDDAPCPDGNTCATTASGAPACQPLSAICMASGQPITCDPQGGMLMCNENGTAMMLASCSSAKLCQAGLASGKCATCVPGSTMCNGKNLERCSSDGSAFQTELDCKSAPLCDPSAGTCKAPVCEAGSFTCNGDTSASSSSSPIFIVFVSWPRGTQGSRGTSLISRGGRRRNTPDNCRQRRHCLG